jgi:hypothetical protein
MVNMMLNRESDTKPWSAAMSVGKRLDALARENLSM